MRCKYLKIQAKFIFSSPIDATALLLLLLNGRHFDWIFCLLENIHNQLRI